MSLSVRKQGNWHCVQGLHINISRKFSIFYQLECYEARSTWLPVLLSAVAHSHFALGKLSYGEGLPSLFSVSSHLHRESRGRVDHRRLGGCYSTVQPEHLTTRRENVLTFPLDYNTDPKQIPYKNNVHTKIHLQLARDHFHKPAWAKKPTIG